MRKDSEREGELERDCCANGSFTIVTHYVAAKEEGKGGRDGAGDNSRINFYACFGGKQQKYLSHTHTRRVLEKKNNTFLAHFQHINLQQGEVKKEGKRERKRECNAAGQRIRLQAQRLLPLLLLSLSLSISHFMHIV